MQALISASVFIGEPGEDSKVLLMSQNPVGQRTANPYTTVTIVHHSPSLQTRPSLIYSSIHNLANKTKISCLMLYVLDYLHLNCMPHPPSISRITNFFLLSQNLLNIFPPPVKHICFDLFSELPWLS